MNILLTSLGSIEDRRLQSTALAWRERHHIVEILHSDRLLGYLRLESAKLAQVDVIVCNADTSPDGIPNSETLEKAILLANEVADLPEFVAQRDGRKWKMLPCIIIGENPFFFYQMPDLRGRHAGIVKPDPSTDGILRQIQEKVDSYYDRLMKEYENRGMMVRFLNGRTQISPALHRKKKYEESEYFYVSADRRGLKRNTWLTVMRDKTGIQADVSMLEQLINTNASEQEMQRFFEEHPAILMQARLGIPVAHPHVTYPSPNTLDFAVTPILGALQGDPVELLELKGPDAPLLNNLRLHRGLSTALHKAIDQVRDYGRFVSNPLNAIRLIKKLGYLPAAPKLAILIGRDYAEQTKEEIFRRREQELIDVKVITYDEILEGQQKQASRLILPGDDDFILPI
jgi:hypothetical protein